MPSRAVLITTTLYLITGGFTLSASAEPFACIEYANVGFQRETGMRVSKFETDKYILNVSIPQSLSEKPSITNGDLLFYKDSRIPGTNAHCAMFGLGTIHCTSPHGFHIRFYTKNYHYVLSYSPLTYDDIYIAHGKCEPFE